MTVSTNFCSQCRMLQNKFFSSHKLPYPVQISYLKRNTLAKIWVTIKKGAEFLYITSMVDCLLACFAIAYMSYSREYLNVLLSWTPTVSVSALSCFPVFTCAYLIADLAGSLSNSTHCLGTDRLPARHPKLHNQEVSRFIWHSILLRSVSLDWRDDVLHWHDCFFFFSFTYLERLSFGIVNLTASVAQQT